MTGQLDILNVGEGDMKIVFDEKNLLETERAKRIIQDMIKRGYALFVHGADNTLIRVKKFLPATGEYIIADGPTIPPDTEPVIPKSKAGKEPAARKLKMHKAKATVVGRSAGG